MTTAIDTNVLVVLWTGTPEAVQLAQDSLERANSIGPLVISPPVYAELVAAPQRDVVMVEQFLDRAGIGIDWRLDEAVWRLAAMAYRGYVERRRAQGDPGPRRILADFVIGAHAVEHASGLLTFDQGIYRASFPSLNLIVR